MTEGNLAARIGPGTRSEGADAEKEGMHPVDMALHAASLVLQNGGSTTAANRSFANILKGCKKEEVTATYRSDFLAATSVGAGVAKTFFRPVGPIGVNLLRVAEVIGLTDRVAKGEVDATTLAAELARIEKIASPYNRWVMMAAAACTAAFFSQLPGGDWGSLTVALVAAGVGQFFRTLLQARKLAVAPVTLVCGLLSAMIAAVGLRLGVSQEVSVTFIASVIYLVPGLPLINGFLDLVSHRYLAIGITRIVNAALLFLILTIAIALAYTIVL